jgi:putative flippase GtrA
MIQLLRQFSSFFWIGIIAACVHYGLLIGLVQIAHEPVLPSTLIGYTLGGAVSYLLNRRHTFKTGRPHEQSGWRFFVVAGIGFGLTSILMYLFYDLGHVPYLLAQFVTTGILMIWSFTAHKFWTFRFVPPV